jgi:hypothetical protein
MASDKMQIAAHLAPSRSLYVQHTLATINNLCWLSRMKLELCFIPSPEINNMKMAADVSSLHDAGCNSWQRLSTKKHTLKMSPYSWRETLPTLRRLQTAA